jgi:hypothetical protein
MSRAMSNNYSARSADSSQRNNPAEYVADDREAVETDDGPTVADYLAHIARRDGSSSESIADMVKRMAERDG